MAINRRSVIFILGLYLNIQGILSQHFPFTISNQTWTEKQDGFTISLELKTKNCVIDLNSSSDLLTEQCFINGKCNIMHSNNATNASNTTDTSKTTNITNTTHTINTNNTLNTNNTTNTTIDQSAPSDMRYNLLQFSYIKNEADTMITPPKGSMFRTYSGKVRNLNDSWVNVTIGRGISGVMYDGRGTYNLTNLNTTKEGISFLIKEMIVSSRDNATKMNFTCGDVPDFEKDESNEKFEDYMFKNASHVIELAVIVDTTYYSKLNYNLTRVHQRVEKTINELNNILKPLSVFVTVACVDVWTLHDKVYINSFADFTFQSFRTYAQEYLHSPHVDNVQLLSHRKFHSNQFGYTSEGKMCDVQESYGVNFDPMNETNVFHISRTLARHLASNMGIGEYKEDDPCICSPTSPYLHCIMWHNDDANTISKWSDCSLQKWAKLAPYDNLDCLSDGPLSPFNTQSCDKIYIAPETEKFSYTGLVIGVSIGIGIVLLICLTIICVLFHKGEKELLKGERFDPEVYQSHWPSSSMERFDPEVYQSHWPSPSMSISQSRDKSEPQSVSSFSDNRPGKTIVVTADVEDYPKSSSESQPLTEFPSSRRISQQTVKSSSSMDIPMTPIVHSRQPSNDDLKTDEDAVL